MELAATPALLLLLSDAVDAAQRMPQRPRICTTGRALHAAITSDCVEDAAILQAGRLAGPASDDLGDWLLDDVGVPRSRIDDRISAVEQIATARSQVCALRLTQHVGEFGTSGSD